MSDVHGSHTPPPRPGGASGDGSKFVTAFVAGVLVGVFAAVGVVPGGGAGTAPVAANAPSSGGGGITLGDGGGGDGTGNGATGGGLGGDGSADADGATGGIGGLSGSGGATVAGDGGTTGDGSDAAPAGDGSGSDGGGSAQAAGTSGGGVAIGGGSGGGSSGGSGSSSGGSSGSSGGGTGGGAGGGSDACAADNGGATDTGVTATEIKVAATTVDDGPGASLLKQATVAMRAVINQVNAEGGICGRRIRLETKNDSWDAARGRDFIRRFIEDGAFSLLVVPSSEGLAAAIEAGDISRAQIPVIGTTGLRIDEYQDPWVFPVASPTVSIMRIMAAHAHADGARTFGIVWDSKYRFGREGADAFKEYVAGLPGATLKADTPLDPTKAGNYSTEAQQFNNACGTTRDGTECDMVALLLVPQTAERWKEANAGDGPQGRGERTYAAQTLFTDDFATRCGGWCDKLVVWTGYNPPIPPRDNQGVREYVRDVQKALPSIDTSNQFVEGAYLGARVFVDAVQACSPNLTRACIKQTLDQTDYQTQLASTLSWRPNDHMANKFAQAFALEASGGSFNGWQYQNTDFIRDPKG